MTTPLGENGEYEMVGREKESGAKKRDKRLSQREERVKLFLKRLDARLRRADRGFG